MRTLRTAKVVAISICRSVKGSTRWRARKRVPIGSPSAQQRDTERGADLPDRYHLGESVFGVHREISDVDYVTFEHGPPTNAVPAGLQHLFACGHLQLG